MHMVTKEEEKLSKVKLPSVMIRQTTMEHLQVLAAGIGVNSAAGMAATILEASTRVKPENYHVAIAEFIKAGSK